MAKLYLLITFHVFVLCSIASQATFWSTQKMMPDKGDKMASTEAQKRAVKKAQAKCDAIMLRPPKEEGAAIRAAAFAAGQSTQQYVLQAARERLALSMVLAMSVPPYRLSTESWKSSMASTKRPPTRTKTQLPV